VATQREDLATTGDAVSTTGIAGLTLAGDSDGSLMGRYGYTVDNLLAAQVVVNDGSLVEASANEHPDLCWALRGGGGNCGVVTSFTYRLHAVGAGLGGPHRASHRPAGHRCASTATSCRTHRTS
jgi:FAD/FMN-containing dehydrogenase